MSAATVARSTTLPTRSATGAASALRRPVPRLLLPPVAEPVPDPLAEASAQLLLTRSVLSPVTDRAWPVGTPAAAPAPELPDPAGVCGAVVLAAVEALRGVRPLAQLTRWVTPGVLDALTRAASDHARRDGPGGDRRPPAPAGPAAVRGRSGQPVAPVPRATVRRTHVHRVSPTAAEASVVVHDGSRVRAAAVRVEAHRGHWRASVLQIG